MPRVKDKEQTNLWPAAALTTFIFVILIATGLVITFGVIQQLRYIAWEKSLQQAQQSLAAEKELVRQTADLKQLLEQYTNDSFSVSEEEITTAAKSRYNAITKMLPNQADSVAEVMTDWSSLKIPTETKQYLETNDVRSLRIVESLMQQKEWRLYVALTSDNQTYDFYSQEYYSNNTTVTSVIYILNNVAFKLSN